MLFRSSLLYAPAVLLCLTSYSSFAQPVSRILPESGITEERPEKRPTILRSGFSTLVRHEALLWASPFRSPRTTFRILAPLAAATGTAIALDRRLASALPNTADQVRYSKGVSVAGSWHTLAAASGAFVGVGAIMRDRKAIETGLIAAEAIAHTESIAQMLKYATGRERPDYNEAGGGRFWQRQQSFPSGHAMGTWAVATVISKQYRHNRLVRYGVYALPILVSASRIGGQRHFLSDVIVGGTLGHFMGGWLYNRHHRPSPGVSFGVGR